MDSSDKIYVSDARENGRLTKFGNDGKFITMWGSSGRDNGQFSEHHGIDFDSHGHVYVTDTGNSRIQIFTTDGKFLTKWDSKGVNDNQFIMPQDIAIDSQDNIYVSDVGDAHPEIS